MKKLLFFLLLLPGLAVAQTPDPDDVSFNREMRRHGGMGLSQRNYSTADSLAVRAAYDSIASPFFAKTFKANTFTRPQVMTSASGGAPLTLRHLYQNGGGTFGLHIEGTVLGQSGGIKLTNAVPGGVSVVKFENDQGAYAQLWGGSSTDTYAPNALGFQFVKGNASFGLYQAGNAFRFGTSIVPSANDMTYDPYARVLTVNRITGLVAPSAGSDAVNNSTYIAGLAGKVDKVAGKDLSTNDYTTAEKNKLAGAVDAAGAAAAAPVQSVAGRTGSVVLTGEDITSGTVSDAVLSLNIPRLNAANAFTSTNTFASLVTSSIKANAAGDISFLNNAGTQVMKLFADGSVKISSNTASAGVQFAVAGTSLLTGSVSGPATDGASFGANTISHTVSATANNQTLSALTISPTFSTGAFTGVSTYGLNLNGNLRLNGNVVFPTDNTAFLGSSASRLAQVYSVVYNATLIKANATDLQFQNASGIQAMRLYSTGNVNVGTSTTDTGIKLNVEGTGAFSDAVSITKSSGANALTLTAPGSGGGSYALRIDGTTGSQAGGIMLNQQNATGANVVQFKTPTGIITQFWQGGSGDTNAPDGFGFQQVKGDLSFGIYQTGKKIRIGTTIAPATPAPVEIEPVNGNIKMGAVTLAGGGLATIARGATTPVPANGAGTMAYQSGKLWFFDGTKWGEIVPLYN